MTVLLRFDAIGGNTTSPVTIRFEVTPSIGLVWGNIGTTTSTNYNAESFEINIAPAWFTNQIETILFSGYGGFNSLETQPGMYWATLANHQIQLTLTHDLTAAVILLQQLSWAVSESFTSEFWNNWDTPSVAEISSDLIWTANKFLVETQSEINYQNYSTKLDLNNHTFWRSGADRIEKQTLLKYGPHVARWICSTDYRPPIGKAVIRFSSTPASTVLRFSPAAEYCYYDDGGGPIDSGTDLPNFDFKIPIEPQIKRAYLMQPELIVTRVSDGMQIVVDSVSISNSRGQFTASGSIDFSSKGDADRSMNQLLLVQINGYDFYLIPEELNRSQSFGRAQYSASCRSRTAQLAAPIRGPISYSNTVDRSLAGIMGDILTGSGWSVQLVGFTDFNVPAGVFSTAGKAPIESVNEIADMIGCMVVQDEFASTLKIVPRWPVTPWNMPTEIADVNIHDAVILTYSSRDEFNQLCNGCWVRGEQQGVSRHVKRTGTAGNVTTSDVSASLIVTDTPARLVGTAKIADTGRKERVTVSLPVMNDLPPLVKGMLIGVSYFGEVYKGTCDGATINATVDNDGAIDVTQTANIIRHME